MEPMNEVGRLSSLCDVSSERVPGIETNRMGCGSNNRLGDSKSDGSIGPSAAIYCRALVALMSLIRLVSRSGGWRYAGGQ